MLEQIGRNAKAASRVLATATEAQKNEALKKIAQALRSCSAAICAENEKDLSAGRNCGMSEALLDRLMLNDSRVAAIADAMEHVAALPDPVGRVLSETVRPNGLRIVKTAVPIGVIAVIFEARPNVTADSASLCLKSGNAVILRGGKEAILSNIAIADAMRTALAETSLPPDCIQLVTDTSHESAEELMHLNGFVDVLIPRGGRRLIDAVVQNATVPVIQTGAGVCHIYVDRDADVQMAAKIIDNAKTSRPSVCNAAECMLIHRDIAARALPVIAAALAKKHTEIRGDAEIMAILKDGAVPAKDSDWGKEFGDYIIAARIVGSMDEAIEHIYRYSTGHSECIVTENGDTAAAFMDRVDAAAVYHNASTRFTDGGEFGLGAEIGISTQKLHARGPLGLNELTTMKYRVYGSGQIR